MVVTLLLLLTIAIGQVVFLISFINWKGTIRTRWPGAFRHIVALLFGWGAFATLSALGLVLDLFEKDKFSIPALIIVLGISMKLFIVGLFILFVSLLVSHK